MPETKAWDVINAVIVSSDGEVLPVDLNSSSRQISVVAGSSESKEQYSFVLSDYLVGSVTIELTSEEAWDWWAMMCTSKEQLSYKCAPGWNTRICAWVENKRNPLRIDWRTRPDGISEAIVADWGEG
jgi:hypothetical protein